MKGGEKMGKELLKTDIERKDGFLYYCGTYKKGGKKLLTVCEAKMSRGGKKKKKARKK